MTTVRSDGSTSGRLPVVAAAGRGVAGRGAAAGVLAAGAADFGGGGATGAAGLAGGLSGAEGAAVVCEEGGDFAPRLGGGTLIITVDSCGGSLRTSTCVASPSSSLS